MDGMPDDELLFDQGAVDLFAQKQLRPVWRSREEIEAHLEFRELF